jgi:hypothetical protein
VRLVVDEEGRYTVTTRVWAEDWEWDRSDPEGRRRWEGRNPNTWERFKASVR